MQIYKTRLAQRVAVVVVVGSVLAGCAGAPQRKEDQPGTRSIVNVPAEAREEFDAAMAAIQDEKYEEGIKLLNKVVASAPDVAVPYIDLAIAHEKLGDLKSAEDNLKHALTLEPDNPVANNEYGILYRKTGRFREAKQTYEMLLDKYPHYAAAHRNLGILCDIYLRDYGCALNEYEAYSSAVPGDKNAKIWIADLQARIKK
mgnify:CR=1 FL=1